MGIVSIRNKDCVLDDQNGIFRWPLCLCLCIPEVSLWDTLGNVMYDDMKDLI